jgi:hypothetical protein
VVVRMDELLRLLGRVLVWSGVRGLMRDHPGWVGPALVAGAVLVLWVSRRRRRRRWSR